MTVAKQIVFPVCKSIATAITNTFEDDILASLHSDVVSYKSRIEAAGGSIDTQTLMAVDKFIRAGVADGWYEKCLEIYPFLGSDLASSLVKLKYKSGNASSLTNNGFDRTEYTQQTGIGTLTATPYLTTGIIPGDNGITNSNGFFWISPFTGNTNSGAFLGCLGTTNPNHVDVIIGDGWTAAGDTTYLGVFHNRPRITGMNMRSGAVDSFYDTIAVGIGAPTSNQWDEEVALFAARRYNTIYKSAGRIGFACIGNSALTEPQCYYIARAIEQLQKDVGRVFYAPTRTAAVIGDSNSSYSSIAWPDQLSKKVAYKLYNYAHSSAALTKDANGLRQISSQASRFADTDAELFIISVGTNDASDGSVTSSTYQTHLDSLVSALITAKKTVILCSPLYRSDKTSVQCDPWTDAAKTVALTYGCVFVDLDAMIRDKAVPGDWMTDATHANAAGYKLWADRVQYAMQGKMVKEATVDFGSISSGSSATSSITVRGAVNSLDKKVQVIPPNGIAAGLLCHAYVSATDTVTLRVTNGTAGSIDPASGIFTLIVDA